MPPTELDAPVAVRQQNPRNNPIMFQIFQNVQYNVVQHKKYVKEMKKLYRKLDQDAFRESFKNALHYLFTFGDTSANVDRVVEFVSTFCTKLDDEEEFLMFIIEIIFDCQCVSGQSVRYRASQLLAAVLAALGEDASLDDDLCDKLLRLQLERLQDTRSAVRCRAALALQRLQNPMEPDDEVTRAYRFHMSCDPNSSVRRAIIMSIAKCSRNVPFVLERLCDVDEAVRRAAFLYISAISVTQLKVRQRVLTLKVGLTERSSRVRRAVEEILIPGWLSSFKGNIIDLLKAIRLDNAQDTKDSQYVAGKLLESLFERLEISELLKWLPTEMSHRLIPAEMLNKETAWYWRHLAEHLQNDEETLETVLPDLVKLTGYIRAIVESPCPSETENPIMFNTRQSVLHELACMLRVYDASDPAGRSALKDLIIDTLTGDYGPLDSDVIRAFVSALEMVVPDVTPRIEIICGTVSALATREPAEVELPLPPPPVDSTEIKMQRARLRVSLNVAIEAQEEAVRDENYALAAECKAKVADIQRKIEELTVQAQPPPPQPLATIKEKQCDAETLNKCLIILNCALDTPQLKTITPTLQLTFNELEVEIFQNPDIRNNALETVALFGMLDKEFAKDHKAFFFANLVDLTLESTACTVLKCIVDLFCVHGARVFEEDNDAVRDASKIDTSRKRNTNSIDVVEADGTISESALSLSAHSTVIELLLKIMDDPCPPYRLIIVEGLCRLIYLGHLVSPAILSRLLLLWFNPATVEEDVLRQTIGIFFQTFPTSVDGAQEQIQKATLPTLRALANAPSSSPLAEIDQEAVVRFIVSLTRVNHELIDSQGAMAMVLCGYLARRPTCPESALACRMLALLSPPRDALTASDLAITLRDLCLKLPDKQSCRNLTRYLGALEERASISKASSIGVTTEGTIQAEDTITHIGRNTSSLPQPLARSTHVVINETVQEEPEIDETSPSDILSRESEETRPSEIRKTLQEESDTETANKKASGSTSDSSGVSPVKKARVIKGKKKKLSLTRNNKNSKDESNPSKAAKEKINDDQQISKGVKRSRSQRSRENMEKAKASNKCKTDEASKQDEAQRSPSPGESHSNVTVRTSTRGELSSPSTDSSGSSKTKNLKNKKGSKENKKIIESPPLDDLDVTNVTVRKSTRGTVSASDTDSSGSKKGKNTKKGTKKDENRRTTRSSVGSRSSAGSFVQNNSADETELHTIIYDNDVEQELLNDSSELVDSKNVSKPNVTIDETPDASEESEPEEVVPVKGKGKRKEKKKN
ncbi:condensin complex subunit 3 isoform X2 [Pararge aegeria]|uniref:condensin complex subunit 3 isoform X2 n=1 Tax=Pararge aegeria TaxID=116150 RepID=UPI0019D153BC|nr:condensin complex subunit 3 isoform X2 [Pararge aegeria]